MAVDPTIEAMQVIIIANVRELIRQVQSVIEVICKDTQVTCCVGDSKTSNKMAHIVVTTPGWLANMVGKRDTKFDLSKLKVIAFDEADEIFL